MGDSNMDHMLDASRRGHVRRHVLLDLVETGKNTRDGRNMTQEPGAQKTVTTVLQGELQEGSTSRNLMGDCNMDHMLDASRRSHVRCHVLSGLWWKQKETLEMAENMTQEPGAQENCDILREWLVWRQARAPEVE
jgi:hypothetical protein